MSQSVSWSRICFVDSHRAQHQTDKHTYTHIRNLYLPSMQSSPLRCGYFVVANNNNKPHKPKHRRDLCAHNMLIVMKTYLYSETNMHGQTIARRPTDTVPKDSLGHLTSYSIDQSTTTTTNSLRNAQIRHTQIHYQSHNNPKTTQRCATI